MSDLAAHGTQVDCWVGIDGNVYDLTAFVDKHPGGSDEIVDLCGTDGTSAFTGQHSTEQEPVAVLEGAKIGVLG